MKNSISTIVFCVLFFSGTAKVQAQDYKYHSLFVYNFTKYIQWPESTQSGDFVIGVMGNSAITGELEKLVANKSVGAQKIVVKKVKSAAEAEKFQILFIPQNQSKDFDEIQLALKTKPVLIVTEKDGFGKKGSAINFVIQDGKMRFELNLAATQTAGLKVSSQLSSMAML